MEPPMKFFDSPVAQHPRSATAPADPATPALLDEMQRLLSESAEASRLELHLMEHRLTASIEGCGSKLERCVCGTSGFAWFNRSTSTPATSAPSCVDVYGDNPPELRDPSSLTLYDGEPIYDDYGEAIYDDYPYIDFVGTEDSFTIPAPAHSFTRPFNGEPVYDQYDDDLLDEQAERQVHEMSKESLSVLFNGIVTTATTSALLHSIRELPDGVVCDSDSTAPADQHGCLTLLERHPARAVKYVGFGTVASLWLDELRELTMGLDAASALFLWSLREDFGNQVTSRADTLLSSHAGLVSYRECDLPDGVVYNSDSTALTEPARSSANTSTLAHSASTVRLLDTRDGDTNETIVVVPFSCSMDGQIHPDVVIVSSEGPFSGEEHLQIRFQAPAAAAWTARETTTVSMCVLIAGKPDSIPTNTNGTGMNLNSNCMHDNGVLVACLKQQPWPPPIVLVISLDNILIRPIPWPSFILNYVYSLSWTVSLVWKIPMPLHASHNIGSESFILLFRGALLNCLNSCLEMRDPSSFGDMLLVEVCAKLLRAIKISTNLDSAAHQTNQAGQGLNLLDCTFIRPLPWPCLCNREASEYQQSAATILLLSSNLCSILQQQAVFQYNNLNATADKHIILMHSIAPVLSSDIEAASKCSSLTTKATAISWVFIVIKGFIFEKLFELNAVFSMSSIQNCLSWMLARRLCYSTICRLCLVLTSCWVWLHVHEVVPSRKLIELTLYTLHLLVRASVKLDRGIGIMTKLEHDGSEHDSFLILDKFNGGVLVLARNFILFSSTANHLLRKEASNAYNQYDHYDWVCRLCYSSFQWTWDPGGDGGFDWIALAHIISPEIEDETILHCGLMLLLHRLEDKLDVKPGGMLGTDQGPEDMLAQRSPRRSIKGTSAAIWKIIKSIIKPITPGSANNLVLDGPPSSFDHRDGEKLRNGGEVDAEVKKNSDMGLAPQPKLLV